MDSTDGIVCADGSRLLKQAACQCKDLSPCHAGAGAGQSAGRVGKGHAQWQSKISAASQACFQRQDVPDMPALLSADERALHACTAISK
eukprot:364278-Chlamydomonas_euryale.AAC.5